MNWEIELICSLNYLLQEADCLPLLCRFSVLHFWPALFAKSLCTPVSCCSRSVYLFFFCKIPDHAYTIKIYKEPNKNIFSSLIAGQTWVALLDFLLTSQQMVSDKLRGLKNMCLKKRGLELNGFTQLLLCWLRSDVNVALRKVLIWF